MDESRFQDRTEAGRRLAAALVELRDAGEIRDPVVLALPRGGVPVAYEVARALAAPLDLVMVRKIGVPFQPELAAAAVVDGDDPQMVVNAEIVGYARMSEAALEEAKVRELAEIERRRTRYLGQRAPVPVAGKDAVVIDDGIATGATMRTALKALRLKGARSLTLAVPVAPPDTLGILETEVDRVVCLLKPDPLYGIGAHYRDFHQLGDDEVCDLVAAADRITAPGA